MFVTERKKTTTGKCQRNGRKRENGKGVRTFLSNKGKRPSEDIHKVREPVWVRRAVKLADVHDVVLVFQHGSLVVVDVKIVWGREHGDEGGEAGVSAPLVHAVARVLRLVRADDGEELVLLQEIAHGVVAVVVGAATGVVVREQILMGLRAVVFEGIGPQKITHWAKRGGLAKTVDLANVIEGGDVRGDSSVDTEELLVHQCGQGEGVERFHDCVVHLLRVLVQA